MHNQSQSRLLSRLFRKRPLKTLRLGKCLLELPLSYCSLRTLRTFLCTDGSTECSSPLRNNGIGSARPGGSRRLRCWPIPFPRFPWLQWQAAAKPNPLAPLSAWNVSKHSRCLYLVFEQVRRQSGYMCLRTWGRGNHFLCFPVRFPWQLTKWASLRQVLVLLSPSSHRAESDACHYLRVSRVLHFSFAGGGRKGVPTEDHPRIEIGSSWPAAFDLLRY